MLMITPLKKVHLYELYKEPILFDANIFMVGIEKRSIDDNCSFDNMKKLYILPLFEKFQCIYIHQEVYKELDIESKRFIDSYIGKNVTIVGENGLYGKDPLYTTIFQNISNHELVNYTRGNSKDRGEVYSLAYAAYHNFNYFCSKEIMVDNVARELEDLKHVNIITFDIVILNACVYYNELRDNSNNRALRSVYKKYCADVIRRHRLPGTLKEYIEKSRDYI